MNPDMRPDQDMQQSELNRALERKPEIPLSVDFQARLFASLPAEPEPHRAQRISFARMAAYLGAAFLAVVLMTLASMRPNAISTPLGMPFVLELIVLMQLMAVGYWLGTRREG